jgi:hypothetical protein
MSISQKAKSLGAQVIGVVTPTKLFLSVDECGRVFNPERNDEGAIDIEAGSLNSTVPSQRLFESLEITMHKMVKQLIICHNERHTLGTISLCYCWA